MRDRTANVRVDAGLLAEAMKATGLTGGREVAELGLRMLVRLHGQADIRNYRGRLAWDGDLEAMRSDTRQPRP
jgi:Arc/MetJ family transcription regulator